MRHTIPLTIAVALFAAAPAFGQNETATPANAADTNAAVPAPSDNVVTTASPEAAPAPEATAPADAAAPAPAPTTRRSFPWGVLGALGLLGLLGTRKRSS